MFDRSLHIGNLMCFKINNKLFFLTVGMVKHRLSETRSGLYTKKNMIMSRHVLMTRNIHFTYMANTTKN